MDARCRFLQAFAFLTVIPAGAQKTDSEANGLYDYAAFFPLVGIAIGLVSGGVFYAAHLLWSGLIPALLAIAASMMLTGALHEDGLADTADGFGGGWMREQRLTIMKDSRIGAFGVLALGFGTALRVCALALLSPGFGFLSLIAVHAGARFAPVAVLTMDDYAGDPATAKTVYAKDRLARTEARQALLWVLLAILPILIMRPLAVIFGLALAAAFTAALMLYSRKAIGGYCGDVLGAIEQLAEIGLLLGLAAAWGAG